MSNIIPENTPVEIRNVGESRFVGEYAMQRWVVEPGDKTLAPYHAACLWFGDPRAVNVGDANARPELQFRAREIDRLGVKYGLAGDPWYSDDVDMDRETFNEANNDHYKPQRYKAGRHPNLPKCEVYDLNGDRLWTVIEDPEGARDKEPATTTAEKDVTLESINALQAQIKELQNRLLLRDPEAGAKSLRPDQPTTSATSTSATTPDGEAVGDEGRAGIGTETRDPVADPEDPAAQAGPDLPPKERAMISQGLEPRTPPGRTPSPSTSSTSNRARE